MFEILERSAKLLPRYWYGLLVAVVSLVAADALADGCFFWNKAADLNEPSQKAIIHWGDGREVLLLQVKYEGQAEEFAWVVPLPAKPDIQAISPADDPFAEISYYTQHRPRPGMRGDLDQPEDSPGQVTVLERKVVGVYDVAVLSASAPTALSRWLNTNGFLFPEKRTDVLKHYTEKKWVYVAMRIDRKALGTDELRKLRVGELQPIRFTFASQRMVYPLRISSVNAGQTELLLYLLAKTPMVLASPQKLAAMFPIESNISQNFEYDYARDPTYGTYPRVAAEALPATWNALRLPEEAAFFLCKYRAVCGPKDMNDDLEFAPFAPQPYWESRLASEKRWFLKATILELLIGHDERKFAPQLQALLEGAAASPDSALRSQVVSYPKVSRQVCETLVVDRDSAVRASLARNPHVPAAILRKLADDAEASIRNEVARNPAADADILRRLVEDVDHHVVSAAAEHPAVPVDLLRELARSDVTWRRICAADSQRCPFELQSTLADDRDVGVRCALAVNPRTVPALLAKLAADSSGDVRATVARHAGIPKEALEKLADDKDIHVRYAVARNPNSPVGAMRRLATDADSSISEFAREAITLAETLPARVMYQDVSLRTRLRAWELDLPGRRIRRLDRDARPMEMATLHPGTSVEALLQRQPWDSPSDEEFARITAKLKAWLLSRPQAVYYRGGGLGRGEYTEHLAMFYPPSSQAWRLLSSGQRTVFVFHEPREGFREADPRRPPAEFKAFLDAVWGNRGSDPDSVPLRPDYEQAEKLKAYLKASPGCPTELVERGRAITPGLVALVEKGEKAHFPDFQADWKYAASLIGEIGDNRAVPFLLKRLNDPDAMDWYFVKPLGQLKVKQAVPSLVEELRKLGPSGWVVKSSAYGSRATYLVEALEQITGQKFPKDQYSTVTDREATLKAVNAWWEKEGKRLYEPPGGWH